MQSSSMFARLTLAAFLVLSAIGAFGDLQGLHGADTGAPTESGVPDNSVDDTSWGG
ncbi:hypothetical protein GCM10018793_54680 [Streptomyces sulfonofaciens]|uniref:Secreted protein n=1 Tax=Streptomyces sulfonofaciens TaxID=68272 RepID=A0A919L6Z7_9ACTN|nr:hypothetical protein [Streptomyces sulfonofaciens]GHH85689.1 hypothetical protein GCM10018793_54680 [Streptomyces sulfonofaciens]